MSSTDRIRTQAESALAELRRIRDLFARRGDTSEAERVNARVIALKEALS